MNIYKVMMIICADYTDADYCTYKTDQTEFCDYFPTAEIATEKAKELFDEYGVNEYVESVNARVYECSVTADGLKTGNRIFNLYKHE